MEPETCTAAQEEVSDKDQNVHDSPPTTGEKSDEGQQIISERNIYWYRTTLALDYLQPAFLLIVKDEMKTLQEEIKLYFERKLCVEATANDIKLVNNTRAEFSHICTARPYECQTLIYLILQHTDGYVQSYEMVKGTDPQKWLTSPFEFVRLFLEDWMRRDIHDFPECDITALCGLVNSCKPLKNVFASTNIDKVRTVRNRTMHKARLNIDKQEMQKYIGEILDFLQCIKTLPTKALRNTDEITKAIDIIEKLRIGDVRILPGIVVQLIQGWLSSARRQFAHENDVVDTLRQNIVYMENELARLTSGQEAATTLKKAEEMTFQAKIDKLTDENQKLKQQTEDMAKVIEELNKRLETMESRSVGEVCRPKAIPTQRSPAQPEYMTPDISIPVDSGTDLDIDPPSAETRREVEELKRKISNLKEEKRKLQEEIAEIVEQTLILNELIQWYVEQEKKSLILGVSSGFFAGLVGRTVGLWGGLAGVVDGAATGSAIGASTGVATGAAIRVLGMVIETHTKESCREGIQRLECEIHDRRQRISYLAREIADQERVLSNI